MEVVEMVSRLDPGNSVRVAVAQTAPELGANSRNLERTVARLEEAAAAGARLVVFPECALSGYMAESLDELRALAEPVPGPSIARIAKVCSARRVYATVGLVEQGTGAIYNSAALVGPEGLLACYRKAHLPGLGLDRLVAHGNTPFVVHATKIGRIGIAICYDIRFPEPTRLLALQGADIVAFPSNWPSVEKLAPPSAIPDVLTRARAIENRVFLAVADRAGEERGSRFLGRSQLVDVFGNVAAEAGSGEELIYADFDFALARQKDFVYAPGRFETHWFADRRTDLYGPLVDADLWPQSPRRLGDAPLAA
jgi:predicted amidohydrolase